MRPKVITWDCAGTLLDVHWDPASLALGGAAALGFELDEDKATASYRRMLGARWAYFRELNLQRSEAVCDAFWRQMTDDWCVEVGIPIEASPRLVEHANARLFGPEAEFMRPFEDAEPALIALRDEGYRLAVISNWDVSLHKALRRFGLAPYFELAVASLEEGVEKPEVALFHLTLDRLGVGPEEAVHVGDDPLDDLTGAKDAGMRAFLIDRSRDVSKPPYLARLTDLPAMLG